MNVNHVMQLNNDKNYIQYGLQLINNIIITMNYFY